MLLGTNLEAEFIVLGKSLRAEFMLLGKNIGPTNFSLIAVFERSENLKSRLWCPQFSQKQTLG